MVEAIFTWFVITVISMLLNFILEVLKFNSIDGLDWQLLAIKLFLCLFLPPLALILAFLEIIKLFIDR